MPRTFIPGQRLRLHRPSVQARPLRARDRSPPRRLPRPREPGVHRVLVREAEGALRLAARVRDPRPGTGGDYRLRRPLPRPAPLRARLPHPRGGRPDLGRWPNPTNSRGLNRQHHRGAGHFLSSAGNSRNGTNSCQTDRHARIIEARMSRGELVPAGPSGSVREWAEQLVAQARQDGVALTGDGGLLADLMRFAGESEQAYPAMIALKPFLRHPDAPSCRRTLSRQRSGHTTYTKFRTDPRLGAFPNHLPRHEAGRLATAERRRCIGARGSPPTDSHRSGFVPAVNARELTSTRGRRRRGRRSVCPRSAQSPPTPRRCAGRVSVRRGA